MTFDIQNGMLEKVHNCDEHVIIPDSVTSIQSQAFSYCYDMQSIFIPDSVASIAEDAFIDCGKLQAISISPNHPYFFLENDMLISKDGELVAVLPTIVNAVIPDSVTSIRSNKFSAFENLRSVSIPDSVVSIASDAFFYCPSLQSISISPNHPYFFLKNDMLISRSGELIVALSTIVNAVIPDSVTSISTAAFYERENLQSVFIPHSVTSIASYAFYRCESLNSVCIPDSVTTIGEFAFAHCKNLQSLFLPSSVTTLDTGAFAGCSGLQSISIPDSIESLETIPFGMYYEDPHPNLQSFRLSLKHFFMTFTDSDYDEYNNKYIYYELPTLSVILVEARTITCIAPLSDIPKEYKWKACLGFALHEDEYPEELREGYLEYIRTAVESDANGLYDNALKYPELLRLFCREGLIDIDSFSSLFDAVTKRGDVELTSLMLEYRRVHLAADALSDDLTLD